MMSLGTSKAKKPNDAKKQSSISSFFASKKVTRTASDIPGSSAVKPELVRNSSSLSKTFSANSGFTDDISSPDTSLDSIEPNNFRNPNINRSFQTRPKLKTTHVKREVLVIDDDPVEVSYTKLSQVDSLKKSGLKRSNSGDLFDSMTGSARKIQRTGSVISSFVKAKSQDDSLSEEQLKVVKAIVQDRQNVFFTGSAGTGKSVVLRYIVTKLRHLYGDNVGITASTGMAACNISGQTIHKFLGIGIGKGSPLEIYKKIKSNTLLLRRWEALRVLVIDEISMIDGLLFHKLNELAKLLRNKNRPFGGIQLVCCGDFFQLPPVGDGILRTKFCFETEAWKSIINQTIVLTTVFRQKGDSQLIDMLNALRYGELNASMISEFDKLCRRVHYTDGIEPTELYPTRFEVKRANSQRLSQLSSKLYVFKARDNSKNEFSKKQLDNLRCEEVIELKEGAQVMHLINSSDQLVNGSVGTVICFLTQSLWSTFFEFFGSVNVRDPQVVEELRLVSSRIGNTDAWSNEESERYARVPQDRCAMVEKLCQLAARESVESVLPVINFIQNGDDNVVLVPKHEFSIDIGNSKSNTAENENKLIREQLPLLLSWAMSIHKAQGQTINRLKIDLKKIFEMGQTYVALSRATNKESLEIYNFSADRVRVSPIVKEFYRKLIDSQK